jgi:hypothetical protein
MHMYGAQAGFRPLTDCALATTDPGSGVCNVRGSETGISKLVSAGQIISQLVMLAVLVWNALGTEGRF